MKTHLTLHLHAVLVLLTVISALSARADDEADRHALRQIRTNYMEAVNTADLSKIATNLDNDMTGVMVTGVEVHGLDGLNAYWTKVQGLLGPGGKYKVTVNTDKTEIFGDVAVSRGKTDDAVILGTGQELDFNSYWTGICRKENGTWKVLRVEAAMDPVENVFVSLKVKKTALTFGIGGLIAGAILGWLFASVRKIRREPAPVAP